MRRETLPRCSGGAPCETGVLELSLPATDETTIVESPESPAARKVGLIEAMAARAGAREQRHRISLRADMPHIRRRAARKAGVMHQRGIGAKGPRCLALLH